MASWALSRSATLLDRHSNFLHEKSYNVVASLPCPTANGSFFFPKSRFDPLCGRQTDNYCNILSCLLDTQTAAKSYFAALTQAGFFFAQTEIMITRGSQKIFLAREINSSRHTERAIWLKDDWFKAPGSAARQQRWLDDGSKLSKSSCQNEKAG